MKFRVACWMSDHGCRLALDESQPRKLYLATLGGQLSLFSPLTLPNVSPVACCCTFPSSPHTEPRMNISSTTSLPPVTKSIQHYQHIPQATRPQTSPKHLQQHSSSAEVHLAAVLNGSVPTSLTDASSSETQSPIFLPLVEATEVGLLHPLANCFKEDRVCFRRIGALSLAPPKSDEL